MTARRTIIDWLRDRGVEVEVVLEDDPSLPGVVVYSTDSPTGWGSMKITLKDGVFQSARDDQADRDVTTEATVKRWFR